MKDTVLWIDMTWQEIQQAIKQNKILLFVLGTIEQHGPALPTGVDVYLPMHIAEQIAKEIDGVVAPCSNYGYKSLVRAGGGPFFEGSLGLSGKTVISLVEDIMLQLIKQGWRRIVVLDWHLENVPFVYEGIDEALQKAGAIEGLKIIKIDDPNSLGVSNEQGLTEYLFGKDFPGWWVEHASVWETSAMMAAFPSKVQAEKVEDGRPPTPENYDIFPNSPDSSPDNGVFWLATRSTKEKGEKIIKNTVEGILKVIKKEFNI